MHAIVARSTLPSQKCKKLRGWDHFLKFRCRKSVRRCGAKHISKSNVSKTLGFGPLLGGQMSFYLVKSDKNVRVCSSFSYNHQYIALRYTTLDYIPPHDTPLHYTTLLYNTFNCTTLQLQLQPQLHYNYNYTTTTTTTTKLQLQLQQRQQQRQQQRRRQQQEQQHQRQRQQRQQQQQQRRQRQQQQ